MAKEYITKDGQLYKKVEYFDGKFCPFCGGTRLITKRGDEVFHSRMGCMDCDKWIDPVRLRK
jgi:hypothetical protein